MSELLPNSIPDTMPQTEEEEQLAHDTRQKRENEQTDKNKKKRRKKIAGFIAGTLLVGGAGGGVAVYNMTKEKGETESSTSAPLSPEVEPVESIEAVVGQAGSTFENISVKPSQELVKEALQPVTVSEFPTPELALEQFGRIENILDLSATIDTSSNAFPLTPESIQLRDDLLKNMLTEEALSSHNKNDSPAQVVAVELWYINESDAVATQGKAGTWHVDWSPNVVEQVDETTFEAEVDITKTTNFHHLDEDAGKIVLGIDDVMQHTSDVTIVKKGDTWKIHSWKAVD